MITFTLNGREVSTGAPDDSPLLWVIRDEFKLIGTKYGCGIARCGACTVHLEGQPMRACVLPVRAAAGKRVTTIEGLDPRSAGPLQQAWIEAQVPQCGYCQSGQIMQAASLLAANPKPSNDEIFAAMNGNLCRCMAYIRIKQAIRNAAHAMAKEA
jgi:isoquinoline 1-oxidoreductase alpha subunit